MLVSLLDFCVTFFQVYGIWCGMALICIVMIGVFTGAVVENRKKKEDQQKYLPRKVSIGIIVFLCLVFGCWFFVSQINPYYLGYGYSTDKFEVVAQEDNILWGMNRWVISGVRRSGPTIYRIQGLNLDSGRKLFRRLIKNHVAPVVGSKNGIVWTSKDKDFVGMDLRSGKTRIAINEKSLIEKFPVLAKGIYQYNFNPKTSLFDVLSKDGFRISVDPTTNKKVDHPIEPVTDSKYKIDEHYGISEKLSDSSEYYSTAFAFDREDSRNKLIDKDGHILNNDLTFLEGSFLLFDKPSSKLLLMSYETLDRKEFILRCVSLNGELLWEAKQHDLKIGDFFNSEPKFSNASVYKDKLIVAFEGFVVSLNASNGHVNWLTRM